MQGDEFDEYSEQHAWNAVYLDGSWRLVDPTYGSGYVCPKSLVHFNLTRLFGHSVHKSEPSVG